MSAEKSASADRVLMQSNEQSSMKGRGASRSQQHLSAARPSPAANSSKIISNATTTTGKSSRRHHSTDDILPSFSQQQLGAKKSAKTGGSTSKQSPETTNDDSERSLTIEDLSKKLNRSPIGDSSSSKVKGSSRRRRGSNSSDLDDSSRRSVGSQASSKGRRRRRGSDPSALHDPRRSLGSQTSTKSQKSSKNRRSNDEIMPRKHHQRRSKEQLMGSSSVKRTIDDCIEKDISSSSRISSAGSTSGPLDASLGSASRNSIGSVSTNGVHLVKEKKSRSTKLSPDESAPPQRKPKTRDSSRKKTTRSRSRRSISIGRRKRSDSKREPGNKSKQSTESGGSGILDRANKKQGEQQVEEQLADGRAPVSHGTSSQKRFDAPITDKDESHARRKKDGARSASRPKSQGRARNVDSNEIQSSRPESQPRTQNVGSIDISNCKLAASRTSGITTDSKQLEPTLNAEPKKRRGFLNGLKKWGSKRGGFGEHNSSLPHERSAEPKKHKVVEVIHMNTLDLGMHELPPCYSARVNSVDTAQSDTTMKRDNVNRVNLAPGLKDFVLKTAPLGFLYSRGDGELERARGRHSLPRKSDRSAAETNELILSAAAAGEKPDDVAALDKTTPNSMEDESDERHAARKSKKKRKNRKDGKKKSRRSRSLMSLRPPPALGARKSSNRSLEDSIFANRPPEARKPEMLWRWRSSSSQPGTLLESENAKLRSSRSGQNHSQAPSSSSRKHHHEVLLDSTPAPSQQDMEDRRANLMTLETRSMNSRFHQKNAAAVEPSLNRLSDSMVGEVVSACMNSSRMTMSISMMDTSAKSGDSSANLESSANFSVQSNNSHVDDIAAQHSLGTTAETKKKKSTKKKKKGDHL